MKVPLREWLGAMLARVLAIWSIAIVAMLMCRSRTHDKPLPAEPSVAARDAGTAAGR